MSQIAVVGCGQWGKNLVRNFAELGTLGVVCDVDPAKLVPFAERYPGVTVTRSFGEVLESDAIAAVVIASSAASHAALAKRALLADKDVFVEKPLALTVADGRELVELAERRGRILMVGHLLRYHPAVRTLKRLVDQGVLGKLCYVYSHRLNLGRFRTEENILWSFAPHDISSILYLLGEMPASVSAMGGSYLTVGIPDVTVTTMEFGGGVKSHIFVSWLHPSKEHKLVVVGDRGMAVFNDLEPVRKLLLLRHPVEWVERMPVPRLDEAEPVPFEPEEPLRAECRHFLDCLATRRTPDTDGEEGLRVLGVLEACQRTLEGPSRIATVVRTPPKPYFVHETSVVDEPCEIGIGTRIWHFSHVMKHARVGKGCSIGQNVLVSSDVAIGDNVKIQNNVSLYTGVMLEDDVFCGPSMVFTNVVNPRSHVSRKDEYQPTLVRKGATLGANCTIVCGHIIGSYAFVAAGAVVTRDVPDYALVVGNPGRVVGWMCRCGVRLEFAGDHRPGTETAQCLSCGVAYVKRHGRVAQDLPVEVAAG
jgi:UDP-2-acetamido-3-amino-2,3-dideoxy-glucuronate N-acetyltransferase